MTLPELALIAWTRAALGAGLGLLLGDRLSQEQRRAVGWTLLLIGVLTTIPLAFEVFGGRRLSADTDRREEAGSRPPAESPEHLNPVLAASQLQGPCLER